ncbi:MAG TPA: cytochrome c [Chitinophagaceae bacterium]
MLKKNVLWMAACLGIVVLTSCGGNDENKGEGTETTTETTAGGDGGSAAEMGSDPKGIGKFRNVELTHPLDPQMIATGKQVYEVKCQSCHKLTDERLVGPGWKGVTDRRTPEWIMNFSTNVDEMIEKDTAAQKMLEICLVRMPNQNLSDADARGVLEFMRQNDGKN